jgi:hypothetical protein
LRIPARTPILSLDIRSDPRPKGGSGNLGRHPKVPRPRERPMGSPATARATTKCLARPNRALRRSSDSLELENAVTRSRTDLRRSTPALPVLDRGRGAHPDHHLWRNGRVFWVAFTFHTHEGKKYRVRRSLGTEDVAEARARRDALIEKHARQPGWWLALRFVPRVRRARRDSGTTAPAVHVAALAGA